MINGDELRKALERPTIILDGKKHEGTLLSISEWLPLRRRYIGWLTANLSDEDFVKEMTAFFDAMGLPGARILQEPKATVQEALVDFFRCQDRDAAAKGDEAPALPEPSQQA